MLSLYRKDLKELKILTKYKFDIVILPETDSVNEKKTSQFGGGSLNMNTQMSYSDSRAKPVNASPIEYINYLMFAAHISTF